MKIEVEDSDIAANGRSNTNAEDIATGDKKPMSKSKKRLTYIITLVVLLIISVVIIILSKLLRFGVWKIANSGDSASSTSTATSTAPKNNCKDIECSSQYYLCYTTTCVSKCWPLRPKQDQNNYNVSEIGWSIDPKGHFYDGGARITINDSTGETCKLDTSEEKCYTSNDIPHATTVSWTSELGIHLVCT